MRGLTILHAVNVRSRPGVSLPLAIAFSVAAPRNIPKDLLTEVPLRDLDLERQYEEIRRDLARYQEPASAMPTDGETQCRGCGAIQPEEQPRCDCGVFLHFHRVFTCPGCATLVPREARDCARCGSAFWSPVNPPEGEVTEAMVDDYLRHYDRSDDS